MRGQKTEVIQQVTMKVDLPGETKISQVQCRNCGGTLKPENIKMVAGAPMVDARFVEPPISLLKSLSGSSPRADGLRGCRKSHDPVASDAHLDPAGRAMPRRLFASILALVLVLHFRPAHTLRNISRR